MLFERLYEDNVAGKIDDARFAKMSKRYEQEQSENAKKIKALRLELKKDEGKRMDIDGDCGGYNLQWAWSSGRAAGLSI